MLHYSSDGLLACRPCARPRRFIRDCFKKFWLYAMQAAQEKAKRFRAVGCMDLAFHPLVVWVKLYGLDKGVRDGVNGLVFCVFASMYAFLKYAKLWNPSRGTVSHPEAR